MTEGQEQKGKRVFFLGQDRSNRKCTFLKAEVLQQLLKRAMKHVLNQKHCFQLGTDKYKVKWRFGRYETRAESSESNFTEINELSSP